MKYVLWDYILYYDSNLQYMKQFQDLNYSFSGEYYYQIQLENVIVIMK